MLNTTGSSLVPLLYSKTAVETVLVTSKSFGVLLHAWILNDSLGFVVLILVHLSNNYEIRKKYCNNLCQKVKNNVQRNNYNIPGVDRMESHNSNTNWLFV